MRSRPPRTSSPARAGCAACAGATRCTCPPHGDCSLEGPPGQRTIGEWMKLGFERAGPKPLPARRARHRRLSHDAVRRLRPGVPRHREFQGHPPLQHVRPLRAVRRRSRRPHRRWRRLLTCRPRRSRSRAPRRSRRSRSGCRSSAIRLDKIDGKIGSNTRRQVGTYQKTNGLKIDCWPTEAMLVAPAFHRRARAPIAAR